MYAVCPCVGQAENTAEPVEIPFWESYSCGPKEPCIRWRSRPTHVKGFEIAFEISYKNALYKFTVIIIIIIKGQFRELSDPMKSFGSL